MMRPNVSTRLLTGRPPIAAVSFAIAVAAAGCPSTNSAVDTGTGAETDPSPADTAVDTRPDRDGAGPDGRETETGAETTSLISHEAWRRVEASEDPLESHRPSPIDCPENAVERETLQGEQTLSVSTAGCNYFAVRQRSLAGIDSGDTLRVRVYHFELTHDQSAEAHLAVALDGDVVWERYVPLPADSNLITETFEVSSDHPTDSPIDFHLHNHGNNTWNVIELSRIER